MKTLLMVILIGLFLIAGCAANYTAYKLGSTENEFRKDNFECSQQSKTYGGGSGILGLVSIAAAQDTANKTYKECMEIRGYTIKEK